MARTKKTRSRKSAFVTTIAVAAVTSTVSSGCELLGTATTNPPPPTMTTCPSNAPEDGDSCFAFETGLSCDYEGNCESTIATCGANGSWDVVEEIISCNPPPPVLCPEALPVEGDDCTDFAEESFGFIEPCVFAVDTSCGQQTAVATCEETSESGSFVWRIEAPSCKGTPAACTQYDHPSLCAADEACRYLTPGCAENPETAAPTGCFPKTDCQSDSECGASEQCSTVVAMPSCAMAAPGEPACLACGEEASVCTPMK